MIPNTKPSIWLLLLLASLMLSACGTKISVTRPVSASAVAGIDNWVASELTPALIKKIAGHPRFEGESIAIVKLAGNELDPAIDSLTERMRRELENGLLQTGGVSLIWQRPGDRSAGCNSLDDAGFFLGLETTVSGSQLGVRVRMLDRRDNSWVPRLSYQYRGAADRTIEQLTASIAADASLLGTRVSPFKADERDLAAQQLSQKLSCVIKAKRQTAALAMDSVQGGEADLRNLHGLLGNYLQQQPGISVVRAGQNVDYQVQLQVLRVDSKRSQVWLRPHAVGAQPAVDAVHAYVMHDSNAAEQVTLPVEVVLPENESVSTAPDAGSALSLIEDFRVHTPSDRSLCNSRNPWASGSVALADAASLPSGSCFALRTQLKQPAYVYLLHEDPGGALTRLLPDNCALRRQQARKSGVRSWFPRQESAQVLDLDSNTGVENFHVLAMANEEDAAATRLALASLPSISSSCADAKGIVIRDVGTSGLRQRIANDGAAVQWLTREINHE